MSVEPISRKKIYLLVLFLDTIITIARFYQYSRQTIFFHAFYFIAGFVVMAIFWEVILILSKVLDRYLPTNERPEIRIVVQVSISFIFSTLLGAILSIWGLYYYDLKRTDFFTSVAPLFNLLCATAFNLVYFGAYYFREWKFNLLKSEGLLREKAEVRYNALRNQLNPHFLFNALTSLNSLIFENQQLASDFLKQLSRVYRYTLHHKASETVSLKTEIEFINRYIFLLETRFSTSININFNINEADLDRGIVPVTSQILIENAVKHNVISPDKPLNINIATNSRFLIVTNNINRKSQVETSNRLGLENLRALYKYLSPLPIELNEQSGFYTIKIPLI